MLHLTHTMREMQRGCEPPSPSSPSSPSSPASPTSPPSKVPRSSSPSAVQHRRAWGSATLSIQQSQLPEVGATWSKGSFDGGKCFSTRGGSRYHPQCFKCSDCGEDLRGNPGMTTTTTTMQSESKAARSGYGSGATSIGNAYYYESGDAVFCAPCFRTRHGRECGVCSAKLLKWLTRGGFAYCPHHEAQQLLPATVQCAPEYEQLPGTSLPGNSTSGDGPDSRGARNAHHASPLSHSRWR